MFRDGEGNIVTDEFADARDVVSALAAEYEACEHANYVERAKELM